MEIGSRKVLDRLLPELKEQPAWMEFFDALFNDTTSYAYWDYVKTWEVDSNDPSKNIDYSNLPLNELEIPYGPGSLYNLLSACRLYSNLPLLSSAAGILAQVTIPILWSVDNPFIAWITESSQTTGLLVTGLHITAPMYIGPSDSAPHKLSYIAGGTHQSPDVLSIVDGTVHIPVCPSGTISDVKLLLRFPVSYLMWYLQLPESNHANAWRLTKLAEDSVPCYNDCKVTIGGAPTQRYASVSYESPGGLWKPAAGIQDPVIYNYFGLTHIRFTHILLETHNPDEYRVYMAGVDITDRTDIVTITTIGCQAHEKNITFSPYSISGPIHIYIK